MAAHHRHHPTTCCSGCSYGYDCSCNSHCNQPHHCSPVPSSSSPSSMDPLLQAIASQILQSNPPHIYSHYSKRHQNCQLHSFQHQKQRLHQQEETHLVISSLLSRIEALEASLHHLCSDRSRYYESFSSLRDVAARVIQTHFRAFLVRRSRTLRELKDLALVKSAFSSLKSSLSNETHFDFHAVSRKAMDLLVKLDSIQGDDPMVRDGRRSISRDLVRFLEFIEEVAVKRHELSFKARKNLRFVRNVDKSRVIFSGNCSDLDGDQRETIGKLRERVEKIRGYTRIPQNDDEDVVLEGFQHLSDEDDQVESPIVVISKNNGRLRNGVLVNRSGDQPKVKKRVSFAENGNLFKVFSNSNGAISNEDGTCLDDSTTSGDDTGELAENLGAEVEEIKGFSLGTEDDEEETDVVVNGGYSQTSNGERNPRTGIIPRREGNYRIKGHYQGHNGEFVFSAPLPVQMEDKADLMKRRNEVKILG